MSLEKLKEEAKRAASNAYAPYSQFQVGCALMTSTGNIYTGCNVENASYGLTICAERNAIAKAVSSEGKIEIVHIVIYTPTQEATPPCGACRQVISEFSKEGQVTSFCDGKEEAQSTVASLLPGAFSLDN